MGQISNLFGSMMQVILLTMIGVIGLLFISHIHLGVGIVCLFVAGLVIGIKEHQYEG